MALQRREALALAGVALAAATAGFVVGPWLLRGESGNAGAIGAARFRDLAGSERSLSEWRGKILVVNFWATWCAPCLEEIPMLMVAREKYSVFGVEIVGIALDNAVKVLEYVSRVRVGYPVLLADAGGLELMRKLGNQANGLPYTVLLDRAGLPVAHKLGALRQEELDSILAGFVPAGPKQGDGSSGIR